MERKLNIAKCAVAKIKVLIVKYADNKNKNLNLTTAHYCYFLFFFRSLKYLEISLKNKCDNIRESIPKIKIKNCKAFILF